MRRVNRLTTAERGAVIQALVEGNSIRSTCRITGAAKWTVVRLLTAVGAAAEDYQDAALRGLPCRRLQADEIWSYVAAKERTVLRARHPMPDGAGEAWTWVALCRDTKLVPSWLVGKRTQADAAVFMTDLAERITGRPQITTDGFAVYLDAIPWAFKSNVDYGQVVKAYSAPAKEEQRRYSPSVCVGATRKVILGNVAEEEISTSHVERQNLTMRMGMRRFTRLTNGFSKKLANHKAAVALHFLNYNFARPHHALKGMTPAQAAGVSRYRWSVEEIASLLDDPQYADAFKGQPGQSRRKPTEA
jgi:IS1 family transposase